MARKSAPRTARPGQRYCNVCNRWHLVTPRNLRCPACKLTSAGVRRLTAKTVSRAPEVAGQADRVERYRSMVAAGLRLFEGRGR